MRSGSKPGPQLANPEPLLTLTDAHFQNGAVSESLSLLPMNVTITSCMNIGNQSPLGLPKIHD